MFPPREFGFAELNRILLDRVGVIEDQVTDDPAATFDAIGLDSLAFIEFRTALEEDYGVHVSDQDAERIYTLGDAIDYVNERLAERERAQSS